eukprot:504474-Heterocapsa_arctica.AAC.1
MNIITALGIPSRIVNPRSQAAVLTSVNAVVRACRQLVRTTGSVQTLDLFWDDVSYAPVRPSVTSSQCRSRQVQLIQRRDDVSYVPVRPSVTSPL